ncbi:MAG TPA: hypothetical protein VJK09_03235 [Candidatus Paceibacterota bacterium]
MYLTWDEKTITEFADMHIESMYDMGYVFTRIGKGNMQQTRSLRIELKKFELSSENKRILKKTDNLTLTVHDLESGNFEYKWGMAKLAKDFYDRFGEKTFSANKAKELLTKPSKSNFNLLLDYSLGYAICFANKNILHYAYPFYTLSGKVTKNIKDMGLGMMIRAIVWAKENKKKYIYLGSASRPSDTYKLQFSGLEWFTLSDLSRVSSREVEGLGNNGVWNNDTSKLKPLLKA